MTPEAIPLSDVIDIPPALAEALREARHVVALTGAGISAESGLPTFRDAQTGLWARYRPEDLATPEAFERNPRLVWEWYAWRRELAERAEPNPGHRALAEMARRTPRLTLVTQNVDGLQQRAGSREVLELHGNVHRTVCSRERTVIDAWEAAAEPPPTCPRCGAYLRPDVVWFGEMLPVAVLEQALEAASSAAVFLCVGTAAMVQPAASLPFKALAAGAVVVEVNPTETPLTGDAHHVLAASAARALPALLRAAWPEAAAV
jgi:NAD-dependent deacetylase